MNMEPTKFGPPPPSYDQSGGSYPGPPGQQPPYPQAGFQPQPGFQPPPVQATYIAAPVVGPSPVHIQCPSCQAHISTKMQYDTTTKTHLMAGLLCCFICWPCAWLPYVMDSCKNANHYCPNCDAFIGTYQS